MKGTGEAFPSFMMFFLAIALMTVSLNTTNALESRLSQSFNDVEHVAEVRHTQDSLISTSYPTATRFAAHERSLELAAQGGGVEWRYNTLEQLPGEGAQTLKESVDSSLSQYDFSLEGPCSTEDGSRPQTGLRYPDSSPAEELTLRLTFQDHTVSCSYDRVDVNNTRSVSGLVRARDNRYLRLFENARTYHTSLRSRFREQVPDSVSGSVRRCGSVDKSAAEKEANTDLENQIEAAFQVNELDHYSFPDWVEIRKRAIIDSDEQLKHGTSTEIYEYASETSTTEVVGSCGPDNDRDIIETTVTINPGTVQTRLSIEDSKKKVPGPSGWENLVFAVEPYTQDLNSD